MNSHLSRALYTDDLPRVSEAIRNFTVEHPEWGGCHAEFAAAVSSLIPQDNSPLMTSFYQTPVDRTLLPEPKFVGLEIYVGSHRKILSTLGILSQEKLIAYIAKRMILPRPFAGPFYPALWRDAGGSFDELTISSIRESLAIHLTNAGV